MSDYEQTTLWKNAFTHRDDGFNKQRDILAQAYRDFRGRVALLLQQIQRELPALTLHDITHVDALWRIASEIAGPNYPLNPAEALVLGGAFLLHDAAHCRAAFAGGLDELRQTTEWRDTVAQRQCGQEQLAEGSEAFQLVLFDTLRVLHPKQARQLAFASWPDQSGRNSLHLFPHDELREAYGYVIGEIAQSHWLHPHELEPFARRIVSAPTYLAPVDWTVNMLKVAVLLRVADAAHIDAMRAPRLLLAMNQPQGISRDHWLFQARLNQPHCDVGRRELLFTGSPFPSDEQDAWWLAYDAACLVDRELAAARHLLRDHQLEPLAANEVAGIRTPEAFSLHVPTDGCWHPVDASLRISDIKSVVERFGGNMLYGDKPYLALRELLQNARDAVIACRALGGLDETEGQIEVELDERDGETWLHVTDTGIGMSRYVITEVLLNFGRSLWHDSALRSEWPGLAASGFNAVGRFGIGFFAVFMLGDRVKVATRRFNTHHHDEEKQWLLEFPKGLALRPILRPPQPTEELHRSGTRVSVCLKDKPSLLLIKDKRIDEDFCSPTVDNPIPYSLDQVVGALAPALEVDVWTIEDNKSRVKTITAGDWLYLDPIKLQERLLPIAKSHKIHEWLTGCINIPEIPLTLMTDAAGNTWGRCGVDRNTSFGKGVVTVGGLYGGLIKNLKGILVGEQLDRLDRSVAVPSVPANALTNWANSYAALLIQKNSLNFTSSEILLALGARNDDLFITSTGKESLTPPMFRSLVAQIDEFYSEFVSISYSKEDTVAKYEYDVHLELNSKFLMEERYFNVLTEGFIEDSEWPTQLLLGIPRASTEIVKQILDEVWGDWKNDTLDWRVIGTVLGTPITRMVQIWQRKI